MKIDELVEQHFGALMPSNETRSAAQLVVDMYDDIATTASALTCAYVRHYAEAPLRDGDIIVRMERIVEWTQWDVYHRTRLGKLKPVLHWQSLGQRPS